MIAAKAVAQDGSIKIFILTLKKIPFNKEEECINNFFFSNLNYFFDVFLNDFMGNFTDWNPKSVTDSLRIILIYL